MISIIIPTYNEAQCLEANLQSARRLRHETAMELIVSDGGSDDGTVAIARRHARVIEGPKGRALQLNAGARLARGNVLFFVHAHVTIPPGALRLIGEKIHDEGYDGGGFSNVFSRHNGRIKTLGRVLNLRVADNDRPDNTVFFGDNGIFVRRQVFDALGGFRALPIMEDYDFSMRLREGFRVVRICDPKLVVSPRRHVRAGFVKTRLQWIVVKRLYRLGVPPTVLARWYGDVR